MTKTSLKKSWIILNSVSLLGTVIALACAGDWGPEYGTSNFTPEVFVANAYSPFFYSEQYYYGIGHDEGQLTRWNESNAHDWAAWLGTNMSIPQIRYLLDTASTTAINSLLNQHPDKKTTAFLHYLAIAKKAGAFALNPIPEPWDADTTKKVPFDATTLNQQLQQALTTTSDLFLKERYWFQLVRSYFFNGTPQQTIHLFEDYRAKFPANKIWYRSLAYTAGAWHKLKDYGKANYYYSRVFDSCDELKMAAHYSFHPQEQADWNATLVGCHTNEEKATLWQMVGIFYSDPNNAIGEIYRLDPRSEKLEVLLSRAINVAEQNFPKYADHQTYSLISHIADAGNTAKPWIWQLAAGYLAMLQHDFKLAEAYYRKAETTVPHEAAPQEQFRLLKMLNTIAATPIIDHNFEQKLLPDIQWLTNNKKSPDIRTSTALEWLKKTFAARYKAAGDPVKAECFVHQSVFFTDNGKVEALKTFLAKPAKTPYEQLCAQLSRIKLTDIYDYQSTLLAMGGHIDEALTTIDHVPNAAKDTLPGNPFKARIIDCHDCDHAAPQKIKYTKLSFLEKLKELKTKINAGEDVYTNAVLLGNAQYNLTHFGNARAFYEGAVLGSDYGIPETIDSAFRAPLTDMTSAIEAYTLAAGAARTDEQRAKCQYLLAKCQRNQWYMKNFPAIFDGYDYKGPAFIAFDGFKNLKKYANTNYYKEVLGECGYFSTYIQKNP